MADTKGIEMALTAARETRYAIFHAQARHTFTTAGQYFVYIGLMTNVPNQSIEWCVEYIMQRHGKFHRAQI